ADDGADGKDADVHEFEELSKPNRRPSPPSSTPSILMLQSEYTYTRSHRALTIPRLDFMISSRSLLGMAMSSFGV
ncbi:MAG: hypothetical protein ACK2UC_15865, partial [Anaerolineae bacterium]